MTNNVKGGKSKVTPVCCGSSSSAARETPTGLNNVDCDSMLTTHLDSSEAYVNNEPEVAQWSVHASTNESEDVVADENISCIDGDVLKDNHSSNRPFSFLHWNVSGLISKLNDKDFVSYIRSFDFICLVETFLEDFQSTIFFGYSVFSKPAIKYTKQGRRSGGIVCLIRNEFIRYVRKIDVEFSNFLVFIIDKNLFGVAKDIIYVCAYVPPEGSPFYSYFDVDNGIGLLEECLTDCLLALNDVYVILSGDLNGRTSNISHDFLSNENVVDLLHRSTSVNSGRCSQDTVLNNYGKLLLNMCTVLDLCILNGVCEGDLQGRYTYISETGCSVNDYFVLSTDLFALVYTSCELFVTERIESDHMPLEFQVTFPQEYLPHTKVSDEDVFLEKFVWNPANAHLFIDSMCTNETFAMLDHAVSLIDQDINEALYVFDECIRQKADCMKKRIPVYKSKNSEDWFDKECHDSRKMVRKLLRVFRRTLKSCDRDAFCKARREYKNMLKRKKRFYNSALLDELVTSIKDQKEFWENVHKLSFKRKQVSNNISVDTWFQHFRSLLEKEVNTEHAIENEDIDSYFNRPISKEEVLVALRKLKNRKAAGPDGIIGELLKNSGSQILNFLVKFFNALFDKGIFPESWTESIILPLYKKGDANNPNNYRGITLCNVCSKIYSTIINNRLLEWVEENNITGEHQAGFKRNYSTIDHMFTLLSFVQKQFSFNRKLYVAFIDFEKAFDSINRSLLWPILLKNGIKGKLFQCIRSMYDNVKVRVRCGAKLSEYINCTFGVKQGDVCSPVLFSLFVNELALDVIDNGRHGATFNIDFYELFILLLADDVVLLSESVVGLQNQLNSLQRAASSLQLKVNMTKSNIIVFRKGGYLGARERWLYSGIVMPVVNVYKYLGIYFSTRLSFGAACLDLASRAKNALLSIMQKLSVLENNSLELYLKLFDSQVQPIAQYGAELWGLDKAAAHCEKVHLYALKKFLGVDMRTPNDLVYGETNRYPIFLNSAIKCIRYWLKVTRMNDSRLPYKAYKMLYDLDSRGKSNWVSNIRFKLYQYGFGYVWLNQGVERIHQFLNTFRERLIQCRWQEWDLHIQTSDRFNFYSTFGASHDSKLYLRMNIDRHLKFIMTRFRLGISDISVHQYRYKRCVPKDLICPLCKQMKEDEIHFVLCCPALNSIREQLIPSKFYRHPNLFRLSLLMSSKHEETVRKFSVYLYRAFKMRSIACS